MATFLHRERLGNFVVHPTDPKTLKVEVEPGALLSSTGIAVSGITDSINYGSVQVLDSVQTVGPFDVAAAGNIRKDLVVIATNLSISIIKGVEIAAPGPAIAPIFPSNLIPLAIISITAITIQLDASNIQDVRPFLAAHQDRTRNIIPVWQDGVIAPAVGTSGDFNTVVFSPGAGQSIEFQLTIPEDFDYNRNMRLRLRGFTGGAGAVDNIQWDVRVTRVALGAGAGALPPGGAITTNTTFEAANDGSYEVYTIPIVGPTGADHFALRTLFPGDLLSFVVLRNAGDPYLGNIDLVDGPIDYNIGYSVYAG